MVILKSNPSIWAILGCFGVFEFFCRIPLIFIWPVVISTSNPSIWVTLMCFALILSWIGRIWFLTSSSFNFYVICGWQNIQPVNLQRMPVILMCFAFISSKFGRIRFLASSSFKFYAICGLQNIQPVNLHRMPIILRHFARVLKRFEVLGRNLVFI